MIPRTLAHLVLDRSQQLPIVTVIVTVIMTVIVFRRVERSVVYAGDRRTQIESTDVLPRRELHQVRWE